MRSNRYCSALPRCWIPPIYPPRSPGVRVLRSTVARFHGDMERSLELAQQALRQLPIDDQMLRAAAVMNIGVAYLQCGDRLAGSKYWPKRSPSAWQVVPGISRWGPWKNSLPIKPGTASSRGPNGLVKRRLFRPLAGDVPLMPAVGMAHIGIGEVLCEWNDLEGATQALTHGLQLLRGTTEPGLRVRGYTALARTQQARGDVDDALLTLQEGEEWLVQTQLSRLGACAWLAAQQARLAVSQGNLVAALHWAEATPLDKETSLGYVQRLTLVRLRLAQHQRDPQPRFLREATQMLAPLSQCG